MKPANKVKTYRLLLNMSQRQMAEKMEMTCATYCRKEKSPETFNGDEMQKYILIVRAIYPKITADEIFFAKDIT